MTRRNIDHARWLLANHLHHSRGYDHPGPPPGQETTMNAYRTSETLEYDEKNGTVLNIQYAPCPDEDAARELEIWKDNTQEFYFHEQWIIERATAHAERGNYDHARLVTALERNYANTAKQYCKTMGGTVRTVFPKQLRQWMAERDAEEHRRDILNWP